jgi:hypothetical protein
MAKIEPKYRKQLNQGQLDVLELLYKFRFGTTELIATGLGKRNGTSIKSRLSILREQGFIERHYDGKDKLQGKHAVYYLKPGAIRALQSQTKRTDITDRTIKNIYKDAAASSQFIEHCLSVFTALTRLSALYGKNLKYFTKANLASFDYFPQPLPDGFLSYKGESGTRRFFLDIFEAATPAFALNRRVKQFIDYYEAGEWEATNSDFPAILIICETSILQNRIEKRIQTALNSSEADDLLFATTNWQALNANEWRPAGSDERVSLLEL